jgi:hypothetical protein
MSEKGAKDKDTSSTEEENTTETNVPTKNTVLAAKEIVSLLGKKYKEGEDLEEHLLKLEDLAELMMVDDLVIYQAILLSLDDTVREEFNGWLKTEDYRSAVKGKPEKLKERLLEKFQIRKTQLERVEYILQPRRREKQLVVDLQERRRVYTDFVADFDKNRERLMIDAALQMLHPDDRTDYCNLNPREDKRGMESLLEFVKRRENERLRDAKFGELKKKIVAEEAKRVVAKSDGSGHVSSDVKKIVAARAKQKKIVTEKVKLKSSHDSDDDTEDESEDADAERKTLIEEGRCFVCKKVGHMAAVCPLLRTKQTKLVDEDDKKSREVRRGSDGLK